MTLGFIKLKLQNQKISQGKWFLAKFGNNVLIYTEDFFMEEIKTLLQLGDG